MNFSVTVKKKLFEMIDEMNSYAWLFVQNPLKDFSREKKWSFSNTLKFMISMEGKSMRDELLEYFDFDKSTPTNSSFNQRRAQYRKLLNFYSTNSRIILAKKLPAIKDFV